MAARRWRMTPPASIVIANLGTNLIEATKFDL